MRGKYKETGAFTQEVLAVWKRTEALVSMGGCFSWTGKHRQEFGASCLGDSWWIRKPCTEWAEEKKKISSWTGERRREKK